MIIGKFKSNKPLMFASLLTIAIVLWIDGFIGYNQTALPVENATPIYRLIAVFFESYSFLSVLLSFVFMLVQAFMFNRVITDKNLVVRNSWLPALLYIVLMSSSFSFFGLQPIWFANYFLIIALDKMFEVFMDESANIEIFNIGLFISLASLFYFPAIVLLLLLISALVIYYLLNIKQIIASVLGVLIPWFFVFLYFFWFDLTDQANIQIQSFYLNRGLLTTTITPFNLAYIWVIGIITLVSMIRIYLGISRDKPIMIRKRLQVLLAYLIIATLTTLFAGAELPINHGLLLLPVAALISVFFQENKKNFINEISFSILILMIIIGKLARIDY